MPKIADSPLIRIKGTAGAGRDLRALDPPSSGNPARHQLTSQLAALVAAPVAIKLGRGTP
jgi:hypothetical protein